MSDLLPYITIPGRAHDYLKNVYGNAAFNPDDSVKPEYIDKAIERIKSGKGKDHNGILNILYSAQKSKKM